ncbi:MAG: 4-hydroxyphenylacetate 3-hydroxylase C-terminal domain-containing protein, partial [Stellaceae bacterium]
DQGRSHFDQPVGSRFEEMDCIVFFDDVVVPWERVFLLYDVNRLNATPHITHSTAHSAHQGAAKNLAKCEFVLGIALLMTQTLGNANLPLTEAYIGELMLTTELTRACMRAAEADAEIDQWGVMCPAILPAESTRNLFMTAYPRMIEILQLLGSSSFLLTPSEKDFAGPLAPQIEQYLATDTCTAKERVKLFRLAWDVAGNAFGSRQVLYERFFASDPLTRARALAAAYPKEQVMNRVLEFLGRSDEEW